MNGVRNSVVQLPLGSYTKRDFCFGKYFKAINQFGKMVLRSVFLLLYQTLNTIGGTLPVRDYCLHELQWSGVVYNRTFNSSEKQILSKDPTSDEFVCDVAILFKVITQMLGKFIDPIKKEIRDLKNLRNTVSHEDLQMDEPELARLMGELKGLCRTILEGTATLTGRDLTNEINEVESGLQELLLAKLENSDIEIYLQNLEDFRQEKHSKMISEGRKEVMKVYSKLTVLNPCSWLSDDNFKDFTVENVFTSLKLVDSGTKVMMNDILNVATLKQRFVPRVVIVRGVMGAGKTSLNRYLLQQWCTHTCSVAGLMAVDIVIAMEMRAVSCSSLVQFLREQLLKTTSQLFSESDIIPVLQNLNVLFLIDGMDEATNQGRAVVREVINKFTDSSIIVTTRPEFALELMLMAEDHVVLQLEGFDEESQNKYIEKIFSIMYPDQERRDEETQAFLSYKSGVCASLSSHLTLPLTLALLLILWCDDKLKVTTVTTTARLYSKIYEMCRNKLTARLEATGTGHRASLKLKVLRWQVELGKVAWDMMCEDVLSLSHERSEYLFNLCEKEGIDAIQTMSTFLDCITEQTLTGTEYHFSFHHSSGQEFLAAFYVSEQVGKSGSLFLTLNHVTCSRFQALMMYVTGLLKLNNQLTTSIVGEIKSVMMSKLENQASDSMVWGRLLKEGESDPALCKAVGTVIQQEKSWVVNSWDPPDSTEVKANLLRETGAAPSEVIIHVDYTTSLAECPELQDILKLVTLEGKSKVKLYLDQHFDISTEQGEIEEQVTKLLQSNRLLEFKGHFGYHSAMHLEKATRAESLYIRVTSLETLTQLSLSLRKHRRWKTKIITSRKWSLKSLELFLDLETDINPEDFPYLHYQKRLVVKIAGLCDEHAKWVGDVLHRLSRHYTSVIMQESRFSIKGAKILLDAVSRVTVDEVLILSDQPTSKEEIQMLARKSGINIGWREA